jgi:putative ABC transport system substrate-binding protein
MRRRDFVTLLGGAVAWPLAARAQRSDKPAPRVGVLLYDGTDPNYGSFRRGLRELGYVEGQTIVLEPRSAESKPERLPVLARELATASPTSSTCSAAMWRPSCAQRPAPSRSSWQ